MKKKHWKRAKCVTALCLSVVLGLNGEGSAFAGTLMKAEAVTYEWDDQSDKIATVKNQSDFAEKINDLNNQYSFSLVSLDLIF